MVNNTWQGSQKSKGKKMSVLQPFKNRCSAFAGISPVPAKDRIAVMNQKDSGIYVLNNNYINIGDRREKTIYAISAMENGSHIDIEIPATWVPINILDSVNRETALGSRFFRQAIASGRLILLHPADAEKVLENEDAALEYERAMNSIKNIDHAFDLAEENKKDSGQANRTVDRSEEELEADLCNPKVIDLCDRPEDKLDVKDVRAFLINERDNLSAIDVKYMLQHLPSSIKNNAQVGTMLANIKGEIA